MNAMAFGFAALVAFRERGSRKKLPEKESEGNGG
jgi:hypothetical protein